MTAKHPEIVIVRRRGAHEDGHHGGAWKMAFADFMTAMMAFFLVLWMISATDKNTKTLIARYFNPVKLEDPSKAQKGIHGAPEKTTSSPGKESGAPNVDKRTFERGDGGAQVSTSNQTDQRRSTSSSSQTPPDPAKPYPTMSEQELFSDPSASLDKIAGAPPQGPRIDASAAMKGYGEVGPSADEALRDPFRPLGSDVAVNVVASNPGGPPAAATPGDEAGPKSTSGETAAQEDAKAAPPPPAPKPDETQGTESHEASAAPAPDAAAAREVAAANLLADLKKRLGGEAQSIQGPQLEVQATEEGILISLTDRQNFSMFAIGSAEPQPRVLHMMDAIAASVQTMPGAIVVRGHTDARPYRSATYDNWRLSSARAQMAYYMLSRGGLAENRFERIEGWADHRLKDSAHPLAAENRRIEILLRETKP
jgi:chemotaxis protein MotB